MKNALILHGKSSSSRENWFPWLKQELQRKGYTVWCPDIPNFGRPQMREAARHILDLCDLNAESVLIGHSAGATLILGILQNYVKKEPVAKAILVAGFGKSLGAGWEENEGLFKDPFNWSKIKESCKEFVFIHSDDDPYVDLSQGEFLLQKLGGELVTMSGQKHFSTETMGDKLRTFPEILKYV